MMARTETERGTKPPSDGTPNCGAGLSANDLELEGRPTASPVLTRVDPLSDWFTPFKFTILLGLLLLATFPGILFGQQSFFFRDYGVLSYPTIFYARESFWRGELPLWNPLSHCGVPLLAQWGAMVLYPFSIIYLLFPLPWSLGVFCVAHLLLGGCGMYTLATRWTENRFAGAFAGVAFVFNGVVFSSLAWPNYMVALGWMPWVVMATQGAWKTGGRRVIVAAVVGAMQMLSGVPEVILLTWGFLGLLVLVNIAQAPGARVRPALRFSAVVVLIAGLTAAQLLPFFELMAYSHRHSSYGTASWSMPAWGWANLLLPLFRCVRTPHGVFYQPGHVFLITYYLGIAVIVLAAIAIVKSRSPRVWVLGGCALFGLTISLGDSGYLYPFLKKMFPVVGFARYPIKSIYLTLFAMPLLAAFAIARLRTTDDERSHRRAVLGFSLVVSILIAVLLWIAWQFPFQNQRLPATTLNAGLRWVFLALAAGVLMALRKGPQHWQPLLGCVLLASVWLDAKTLAPLPHPTISAQNFAPGLPPMKSPPKLGQGRALITDWAEDRLYTSGVGNFQDDFLGKRLGLWCNLHLLEGIPKVEGASTLLVREQAEVQGLFYRNPDTDHPSLADFLGVTHINAPEQVTEWVTRSTALPLITAGQKPVFVPGTNALRLLTATNFDPRAVVYLPSASQSQVSVATATEAKIKDVNFASHRVSFHIEAPQACIATIAQTFYPAWRAFIDNRPVSILKGNHAFQSIEVPAGKHRVRLVYVDEKFRVGAMVSLATLCLCAILYWILRRGRVADDRNSGFRS
jgi:hypothetical protein